MTRQVEAGIPPPEHGRPQLFCRDSKTDPFRSPFFEYAGQSALHCPWAKLYLQEQRARGKQHPTAVRALAFKWQRIMFVCWRDRLPYNEATYLATLRRRGSFLAAKLDQLELQKAARLRCQ